MAAGRNNRDGASVICMDGRRLVARRAVCYVGFCFISVETEF